MKVLIRSNHFSGGPRAFRNRIVSAVNDIDGVEVVDSIGSPHNVELAFIRMLGKPRAPMVLRLDGCYYRETGDKINKEIKKSINKSKHIIYQSAFSKKMCEEVLGVSGKPSTVIHNGIDLEWVNKINPDPTIEDGSFVAIADWRETKRPNSMIRGFLEAGLSSKLYVIGKPDKIDKKLRKQKNVVFLGKLDHEKSISIMRACKYQIHLCVIDSCPNSVVEGLASGLNVLCANLGGTRELVKNNGVIINFDKWPGVRTQKKLDNLPSDIVADGIHKMMKNFRSVDKRRLSIDICAREYVDVLRKVS